MRHMSLREEDHQLLLHLHDFVYLHKDFIAKYIFKSYTGHHSLYRRLRALENAGYLKVFSLQIDDQDHRPSNVYTLTKFGVDTVEQLRGVVHWRTDWTAQPAVWYRHQLMIAEAVKQFELRAAEYGLEMKEWITEARASYNFPMAGSATKKNTSIRPDGIIVLGAPDSDKSLGLLIEMERSYATKERTIRKIDQFNEFFSRRDELMDGYKRKVAFDSSVDYWKLLFIGGTEAKTNKVLRDLSGESPEIQTLVASKDAVLRNPFDAIYRDIQDPEKFITL